MLGGGATTIVVTVDVSSLGVGVGGTLAVLTTVPTLVGWTVMLTALLVAPTARLPTAHVMLVPFAPRAQPMPSATSVVSAGSSSVKVALGKGTGPVLLTLIE